MKRRLLGLFLVICLALSFFPATAMATDPDATSGTCGENLTWTLEDGTLTIAGTGAMANYEQGGAPWYAISDSIAAVVIGDGVTTVGEYAFAGCAAMKSVSIPASVGTVGASAFANCENLASISFGHSAGDTLTVASGAFDHPRSEIIMTSPKETTVTLPDESSIPAAVSSYDWTASHRSVKYVYLNSPYPVCVKRVLATFLPAARPSVAVCIEEKGAAKLGPLWGRLYRCCFRYSYL